MDATQDREGQSRLLRLAGWALAHAAWSVEGGAQLVPLAVIERGDDRELKRYRDASLAHDHLADALSDDDVAALVVDAFVSLDDGSRSDALIVTLHGPANENAGMIVQQYQRARRSVLRWRPSQELALGDREYMGGFDIPDADSVLLQGAMEHREGSRLFAEGRS